jgi:hypothetical protein
MPNLPALPSDTVSTSEAPAKAGPVINNIRSETATPVSHDGENPRSNERRQDSSNSAIALEGRAVMWWPYFGFVLAICGCLGVAVVWRWQQVRDSLVSRDSVDFAKALSIWTDAAFLADPSPREMKRFINRLRFASTGIADLGPSVSGAPALDEPTTVAFATLAHLDESIVELAARDASVSVSKALHRLWPERGPPATPDPAHIEAFIAAEKALQEFSQAFPNAALGGLAAKQFISLWGSATVR